MPNAQGLSYFTNWRYVSYLRDLAQRERPRRERKDSTKWNAPAPDTSGYALLRTDHRVRKRREIAIFLREDLAINVLLSYSSTVCGTLIMHVIDLNFVISITFDHMYFDTPEIVHHTTNHYPPNLGKNTLDLDFTTYTDFTHNVQIISIVIPDHKIIQLIAYGSKRATHTNNIKHDPPLMNLNFRKVKWNEIETKILETNWRSFRTKSYSRSVESMLHINTPVPANTWFHEIDGYQCVTESNQQTTIKPNSQQLRLRKEKKEHRIGPKTISWNKKNC